MSLGASSASEKRCHMDFKGYRQALEQIDEECSKEDLDAWAQSQFQKERAVALRDLQAAKKYGTITPAYNGVRGDKRWKIAYGDVVYITDEQQKLVITTYQFQPRVDSIYIGPVTVLLHLD